MMTTVTAAHHFTWRYRYASNWSAQTLRRFVIACQIFSMNIIWQKEEALIRHSTEFADGKGETNWKGDLKKRTVQVAPWLWPNDVLYCTFLESQARWHVYQQNCRAPSFLLCCFGNLPVLQVLWGGNTIFPSQGGFIFKHNHALFSIFMLYFLFCLHTCG